MTKYKLYKKLSKGNSKILAVSSLIMIVLVIVLDFFFFIQQNNAGIFNSYIENWNEGEVSVIIQNSDALSKTNLSEKQLNHLEKLKLQKSEVSTEQYMITSLTMNKEELLVVVRYSAMLEENSCIISNQLANILSKAEKETISLEELDKTFYIEQNENNRMSTLDAVFYGYIVLPENDWNTIAENNVINNKNKEFANKISITVNEMDEAAVIESLKTEFSVETAQDCKVTFITAESLSKEYGSFFGGVEKLLAFLSILCTGLSAGSFVVLFYIKMRKQRKTYAMLHVLGFNKKTGILYVILDTAIISGISNLCGFAGAYIIVSRLSKWITKGAYIDSFFTLSNANVFLQGFVITTFLILLCCIPIYLLIESETILSLLYQRKESTLNNGKILIAYLVGIYGFSFLLAAMKRQKEIVMYIFGIFCFFVALYFLIRCILFLIDKIRISGTGIAQLGIKLTLRRKEVTALVSTIMVVAILVLVVLFQTSTGLDAMIEQSWTVNQEFNTCVEFTTSEPEFESKLQEWNKDYYKIYTELLHTKKSDFYLGILDDSNHISDKISVKKGEIFADDYFMYRNDVKLGSSYFLGGKNLKLTKRLPNFGISPISYSALVNIDDARERVENSHLFFLFTLTKQEQEQLVQLAKPYQVTITTAYDLVELLKSGMSGYLKIIYYASSLLGLVVLIFVSAIIYLMYKTREYEFNIYTYLGASSQMLKKVTLFENIMIAIVSVISAAIVLMIVGGGISKMLLNTAYQLPCIAILLAFTATICILMVITRITMRFWNK